jgi:hypothetical protein
LYSEINKYVIVTPIVAIIAAVVSFVANRPIIKTIKILTIEYSKKVVIQLGNLGATREAYKIKIIYNTALTYLI